ncbi:MAG TPA: hypothetical protein ENI53_00835 [Thermoplasmatales archaeon]|nr:hypothetical protein [Thermoplasmatales archaeon]
MGSKIWLGTAIKEDELPSIINIGIIIKKATVKGLIFRGLIKYFEEQAERKNDEKIQRKYREAVKELKKSLGIL